MSEKRQKNQIELAFTYAPKGEALRVYGRDRSACGAGGNRKPDRQLRAVKSSIADGSTSRTAVCGSACTVVWEGRSREAPPYPDRDARSPFQPGRAPAREAHPKGDDHRFARGTSTASCLSMHPPSFPSISIRPCIHRD